MVPELSLFNETDPEFCIANDSVSIILLYDHDLHNDTWRIACRELYCKDSVCHQNGGDPTAGHSNAPLRGGKGSIWEGGTRTPAFISGPMLHSVPARHDG